MKSFLFTIITLCFTRIVLGQCSVTITPSSYSVCSGETVTLTATSSMTGVVTYTWNNASFGQITTTVMNFTTPFTFSVFAESYGTGSCIATQTINITVLPTPTITAFSTNPICNGVSTTSIICNGANTYTLFPGAVTTTGMFVMNPMVPTTFTVMGADSNGCSNDTTVTVNSASNPTVTIVGNTIVCAGASTTLTATETGGTGVYTCLWYNGASTYSIVPPITSTNTTCFVILTDANGCIGTDTVNINTIQNPTLILTPSSTLCIGSSLTLTVSATGGTPAYSYLTSMGSTIPIVLNPTVTTSFSVVVQDSNGCYSAIETHTLFVDNTCQDVWPGDANGDGIADNTDILELGLHYTQTGAVRTTTNNAWQSFHATNWIGTITNGKNVNHSDCNGDGTINQDDTLAIYNNYGLTHTFKLSNVESTNPALNIVPDQTMVDKGKWGTASIYLGDATNVMNNVNGVAYTLNYDNTLIEQDSVYLTYQNSFIDAGQNLHFRKTNFTTGALYTASTHTNNTNVSGFGKIATLHYKIRPDLATDSPLNLSITQAVVSNASGSITPITSGASTVIAIGASVGIKDYATNSNFLMFPNPTSEMLNIKLEMLNGSVQINIYNALGALVLKENINSKQTTINASYFAKGMYVVELQSNNQVLHRAKLVKE